MQVQVIRGTNQIGGCIVKITSKKGYNIIIDYGEELSEEEINQEFPIAGLTYGTKEIEAVFITHIHGDHIGLIKNIKKEVDVYVEETALKIWEIANAFSGKPIKREIKTFKFGEQIKIKDMIITPYQTDHSAYNSAMFLIQNETKKILHLGDYRATGYSKDIFWKNLQKIGKVDLLITEGTKVNSDTVSWSEEELTNKARDIFKNYKQVFILQASTNIDRLRSFYKAAREEHKKFIIDIEAANILKILNDKELNLEQEDIKVWVSNAYLNDNNLFYQYKEKNFKEKYIKLFLENKGQEKKEVHDSYVMIVKASMLKDIKYNLKKYRDNACLIYALWSGYKSEERKNTEKTRKFIEELKKLNIECRILHTSGHADLKTLRQVNEIIKPQKTIGIHTENKERLLEIFDNFVILNDGDILEI